MTGYTDDNLTTMLRDAAAREALTPRPPAEVRRHAERVRARRRVATVTLAAALAVAGGVAFQQATSPAGLFTTPAPPATAPPSQAPAPTGAPPTASPSTSVPPSPATTDRDDDAAPGSTGAAWPAPPQARGTGDWRPWTLPGYDYGDIVAARMEDGHAVITFDRKQLYTAEQWRTKTGEDWDMDFRVVNESTRTRQFVVEDDAPLYGNWLLNDFAGTERYTPQQLVDRINAVLVEQAVQRSATPSVEGEVLPSIGVFLFHSERENGPVAYLEEATAYTG